MRRSRILLLLLALPMLLGMLAPTAGAATATVSGPPPEVLQLKPANPADPKVKRLYDAGWTNWAEAPPPGLDLETGEVRNAAFTTSTMSTGTVEGDEGDLVVGVTVNKVSCLNSSTVGGPDALYVGACMLVGSDGRNQAKFRLTSYRYSTNMPNSINMGWNQLDPHYRRIYAQRLDGPIAVIGTLPRSACMGCHSSVAYSNRGCGPYPVGTYHFGQTDNLIIRGSDGVLRVMDYWRSGQWNGCGI